MSLLNTTNPIALQVLISETIFDLDFPELSAEQTRGKLVDPNKLEIGKEKLEIKITSWGDNKKNILFILENPYHDFFSKDEELAFVKTLIALKLNMEDVAVINYKDIYANLTFDQIQKDFAPKSCIFLGFDPSKLGLRNCAENIWTNGNNIQLLNSFSFEEMLLDSGKKRMFWDAIKLIDF